MSIHQLKTSQKLPISLEEAWNFLSSPNNLKEITPEHMGFVIRNNVKAEDRMFAGQIIVYKISPFRGWRTEWVTEITHVSEKKYFIDEQRFGPYQLWHHLHELKTIPEGVLMEDTVHYKIPFGIAGELLHRLFIRKKIEDIFSYRKRRLEEIFGKCSQQG